MGLLDRLLGRDEPQAATTPAGTGGAELSDEQALERYRYLVRTAPPDRIEEAHEEAFARLTPEQRREALRELSASVPEGERAGDDDPRSLARMATRAEVREPGSVERAFGRGGMGAGLAGGLGGTLLGSFAAAFAGTIVAQSLMDGLGDEGEGEGERGAEPDAGSEAEGGGASADTGDAGGGGFGDFGGGGDAGGGF